MPNRRCSAARVRSRACSLVRPLLNGREVGYFIFDTGASGFVLDPSVGEALGLRAFGQLQVTSMVGRLASRFRCGLLALR